MSPPDFLEASARPQNFSRVIMRMAALLWRPEMAKWRVRMVFALIVTIIAKIFAVGAPVLLGEGINTATKDGGAAIAASWMPILVAFGLFGLARFAANGLPQLRDAFFVRVTQDANRLLAVEAFSHAQGLSLQFHLTRRAGALSRIIERGAGSMEFLMRFLGFNIGPTLFELALAAIVMAVLYSWKFGFVAVTTVAAYAIATILITEWRNKLRRAMNEADTAWRAIAQDVLTNFETVKAFASEARETGRYNDALGRYNTRYAASSQSLNLLNAVQELIMTCGLVAVAIVAAFQVHAGSLQAGDITAVILMLTNIYRPLNILGFAWREIKQGAVDIEKLFELLDLEPEVKDPPSPKPLPAPAGRLTFDTVSFTHAGRTAGLIDVSFDIPPGAFVGLVGSSGAGKSTILKLLFRFYDPSSGAIRLDGQDIRAFAQKDLRLTFGLVPQDVVLFNDTLRFNIAYARPDAGDDEIMAVARQTQLAGLIESLPDGLDTRVGERGLKLSGGEKQRVGVARAILLDPAVLVLDEATSSLDSETEKEVQTALNEAARGRTTLAVAHRLSTVSGADFIIVLDQGRIIETGTHKALVDRKGVYSALWHRQSADHAR